MSDIETTTGPLPFESTRAAALRAASHWLSLHLAWVPARCSVTIELPCEGDTRWTPDYMTQLGPALPRVRVYFQGMEPAGWAAGVARFWEDGPTTWREIPSGHNAADRFAVVTWTTADGVEVDTYSPHATDLAPYREALVAAGVGLLGGGGAS